MWTWAFILLQTTKFANFVAGWAQGLRLRQDGKNEMAAAGAIVAAEARSKADEIKTVNDANDVFGRNAPDRVRD